MSKLLRCAGCVLAILGLQAGYAAAVCIEGIDPDSCRIAVVFAGSKDRVTIAPQGAESLADAGITIHVFLRHCNGTPIVGLPAAELVLYGPGLCLCPGGWIADGPTDANGMTTFTGVIRGGGCAEDLGIFADGILIGRVPVKTNSADTVDASPCAVDAGDLAAFATALGSTAGYTPCFDFNESGPPTIDAGDLAGFATMLGGSCP